MGSHRYRLSILLTLLLLASLPDLLLAQDKIVELDSVPGREAIPDDCSTWHELWPGFCASSHQDAFEDNGDGELSPCDYIHLDGHRLHVDWVGPTYWTDCDVILEPIDYVPGDPSCQEWIEIWPNYGALYHIESWEDNGDGEVGPCDSITLGGQPPLDCHITDVGVNIHVRDDGTATEDSSWSRVKALFGFPF